LLWDDIFELVQDVLAEDCTGDDYFFVKNRIKQWGATAQLQASRAIGCLSYNGESGYEIELVRDQMIYDQPEDCLGIEAIRYETSNFLAALERKPQIANYTSSQVANWWIQDKRKFGVCPEESASVGLTLTHTGVGTVATYEVTDTTLVTVVTGGGGGTETYTLATYSTIALLVDAINLDTGTQGITAAVSTEGTPGDLEVWAATTCYETTASVYFEPGTSIYLYGTRIAPMYMFSLRHNDTGSPTAVTFSVDATNLSVETTGERALTLVHTGVGTAATYQVTATKLTTVVTGDTGGTQDYTLSSYATMQLLVDDINTNTGTEGITAALVTERDPDDLTVIAATSCFESSVTVLSGYTTNFALAAYQTASTMIAAINAAGIYVTAVKNGLCIDAQAVTNLEHIEDISILADAAKGKSGRKWAFMNPELDDDMLIDIVVEYIMWRSRSKGSEIKVATMHRTNYFGAIEKHRIEWEQRQTAPGMRSIKDVTRYGGTMPGTITDGRGVYTL